MLYTILNIFLITLLVAGTFSTLIGLLTIFYWIKPADKPNDKSNRINNITSWWIGLTRPEVLGTSYKLFRQDVMDNVKDVNK